MQGESKISPFLPKKAQKCKIYKKLTTLEKAKNDILFVKISSQKDCFVTIYLLFNKYFIFATCFGKFASVLAYGTVIPCSCFINSWIYWIFIACSAYACWVSIKPKTKNNIFFSIYSIKQNLALVNCELLQYIGANIGENHNILYIFRKKAL